MSTTRRPRARYASKAQVKRALELAREAGMTPGGFTLGADGSVQILDTAAAAALVGARGEIDEAEAELAACRAEITATTPARR